jgi:hypothetical protein
VRRLIFCATTTAATRRNRFIRWTVTAAELLDGECDRSEKSAGVFVVCCAHAFFFRYAVISCLHENLRRSYNPDDRKNSKGNKDFWAGRIIYKWTVKLCFDGGGNFRNGRDTSLARSCTFAFNARSENERLDGFYDCNGCIATASIDVTYVACIVFRRRRVAGNSSLPTVQDDILFKNADSSKSLRATAEASFEFKLNVVANRDTVKSAIERNFVNANIRPEKPYASSTDVGGVLKDFFAACGKIYPSIFKAVAISATIQNPLRINTNGSLPATGECTIIVSVFQHYNFSLSCFYIIFKRRLSLNLNVILC